MNQKIDMQWADNVVTYLKEKVFTKKRMNSTRNWIWAFFRFFLLFGLSVVILYPLLNMFTLAIRPVEEISDPLVVWIPRSLTFENIVQAWKIGDGFPICFSTSVLLSLLGSLLSIISCSLAGYGFARFKFKGREVLFALVLATIIVPPQVYLVSQYLDFYQFDFFFIGSIIEGIGKIFGGDWNVSVNLIDNYLTLFMPALFGMGIRAGLYIYIFRQFFRGMPKELEDAAYIDGCGPIKTFLRVMAPNASSAFLTVFLFAFVWYWNDYVYIAMFMNRVTTVTAQLLRGTRSEMWSIGTGASADWHKRSVWTQALCLMGIAPLIIMYAFLQRYFIESVDRTGIVG